MNCEATTDQTPHIATSDLAADQNSSYRSPLSSLSILSRPVISDQPVGAGLMDADNADNAMLPGLYKYHEAPSRLSQRHQSCKESELLLETV